MDMKKLIWSEIPHQTFNVLHLTNIFLGKQVANFFQAFCLLLWPNVKIHLQSFTGQKHRHFIFFYIWITDVWKFSIIWNIPVTFKVLQLTNKILETMIFFSKSVISCQVCLIFNFNLYQFCLREPRVKPHQYVYVFLSVNMVMIFAYECKYSMYDNIDGICYWSWTWKN